MSEKKTNYSIHYERLKRHYSFAIKHYDLISFLDLAHSLRIWTEIKKNVTEISDVKEFPLIKYTKKFKKVLSGAPFAFCHLQVA